MVPSRKKASLQGILGPRITRAAMGSSDPSPILFATAATDRQRKNKKRFVFQYRNRFSYIIPLRPSPRNRHCRRHPSQNESKGRHDRNSRNKRFRPAPRQPQHDNYWGIKPLLLSQKIDLVFDADFCQFE